MEKIQNHNKWNEHDNRKCEYKTLLPKLCRNQTQIYPWIRNETKNMRNHATSFLCSNWHHKSTQMTWTYFRSLIWEMVAFYKWNILKHLKTCANCGWTQTRKEHYLPWSKNWGNFHLHQFYWIQELWHFIILLKFGQCDRLMLQLFLKSKSETARIVTEFIQDLKVWE